MAVHTPVEKDAVDAFLAEYGLPPASLFEGISEGVENSNFRLDAGGERLILTLFERRTEEADLPYFLALMGHVARKGLPAAEPLQGRDGRILRRLAGKPAVLVQRLLGSWPRRPTLWQAEAAGRALAGLHAATVDFRMERQNALGPDGWRALAATMEGELLALDPALPMQIGALAARAERAAAGLPRGTIHADLFPDNVLFEQGRLTGLIDFYFACTGALAYDLAIGINAWTPEPGPDAPVDAAPGAAFRAGYEAVRPLSPAERAALPALLAGSACRFFLTRLHDLHHPPAPDAGGKDPLPYLRLMRQHLSSLKE